MKKNKWIGAIPLSVLSLSLALTGCAGNSGNTAAKPDGAAAPKEVQPLKIGTVVTDGYPASKDVRLWQEIEKQSKIPVEFQDVNASQWKEKKGLMFASNDLPEAFIGHGIFSDSELLNYGSTGALIPLEKLIEQFAPNLKKAFAQYPDLKSQITAPDGHIYAIPSFNDDQPSIKAGYPVFINKAWLEKLNMKVPTTTDEFEQMLQAFKDQDPGGVGKDKVIPFTTFKEQAYFSYLFGSFGLLDHYNPNSPDPLNHIGIKDGKAFYTLVQPEFKEAINYFAKLSSKGLIDKEVFTQDNKAYTAKLRTVPRVVGSMMTWRSTGWSNTPAEAKDYVIMGPLKGPKGTQLWEERETGLVTRASFAITNKAKNPELLMKWIDNILEDDNAMQMATGGRFGDYIKKRDDGKVEFLRNLDPANKDEQFNIPSNTSRITFYTNSNSSRMVSPTAVKIEKGEYDKLYEPHLAKEVYPNIFFSKEEVQKIQTLGNDINTYANGMYAKWIVDGGGVDKDWDAYVKKINEMGLKQLMDVYQGAYDRFKAVKK